jgi:hypothetical protein
VNYSPEGVNYSPEGVNYSPEGVNLGPEGVNYSPEGVNYSPEGVNYSPEGVNYSPEGVNCWVQTHTIAGLLSSVEAVTVFSVECHPDDLATALADISFRSVLVESAFMLVEAAHKVKGFRVEG